MEIESIVPTSPIQSDVYQIRFAKLLFPHFYGSFQYVTRVLMTSSSHAPPSARSCPFIASVGEHVYLWGGWGDREPETVFIHHHDAGTWTRDVTKGPHPPAGLRNGSCTTSGQRLYLYGGYGGGSYHGDLYELNIKNLTWTNVCDGGGAGGPGKKAGCSMIFYQDQLLVVGGYYGKTPSSRQAGASYEGGRTNEVHSYNVTTGKR